MQPFESCGYGFIAEESNLPDLHPGALACYQGYAHDHSTWDGE